MGIEEINKMEGGDLMSDKGDEGGGGDQWAVPVP